MGCCEAFDFVGVPNPCCLKPCCSLVVVDAVDSPPPHQPASTSKRENAPCTTPATLGALLLPSPPPEPAQQAIQVRLEGEAVKEGFKVRWSAWCGHNGAKKTRRRRRRRRREVHTHTHTHPHPHTPTHPHTQAHEKSPFLPLFAGDGRHLQAVARRSAEIVCTFPRCTGVPTDPVSQWRRCVCRRVWSAHIFLNLRLQSLTNTQTTPLEMTPGCHDGLHPHLSPCMPAPTHELRVHTTL